MTSPMYSPCTITALRMKALDFVGNRPGNKELGRLQQAERLEVERETRGSSAARDVGPAPAHLVAALRSRYIEQLVFVHVGPKKVRLLVNGLGRPEPARERAIWTQIVETVWAAA